MILYVLYVVFAINLLLLGVVAGNALLWPRVSREARRETGSVSVLIPARDEEANIRPAIEAALAQGPAVGEILVYDDHSADRTADHVNGLALKSEKVRLVPGQPLPEGWCGKPFGCHNLAAEAKGEWLLFLDADARLAPGAVDRILAETRRRELTFLSCWPGLEVTGFWEKVFMPMLNFVVFTLFPAPLAQKMDLPALGLAHGACIFMRREEYRSVGGHARVRDELFEDTALARIWREAGFRGLCLDGSDLVRVRMYDSAAAIWNGFQKIYYPAFRTEAGFWLFLLFHFLVFLVPIAAALAGAFSGNWLWPAWGAVGVAILARIPQALRFGYPVWSAFFHPLGEAALIAVGLASWYNCRFGRGVPWKGRNYRGPGL